MKQDYCRKHIDTKPIKKKVIVPVTKPKKKATKKNVKKKTARRK